MRHLLLIAVCVVALILFPAPPVIEAAEPLTPVCGCSTTTNTFPTHGYVWGQGRMTESVACTPNSPSGQCTASGTISWAPDVNCCQPSGNDWSTSTSGSYSSCQPSLSQFGSCLTGSANPHSCTVECTSSPGTSVSFTGTVYSCAGSHLGSATKIFACVIL
jgi:hypothetical protein